MPVGYHINPDDGLVTVRGNGDVTIGELIGVGEAILADPAYDSALPQLVDLRGLRPVSRDDLERLQSFVHDDYRDRVAANVAVVIDDHLESRHCADIFLITCAIHDAELFVDYDQALKWLMRNAFATPRTAAGTGSAEQQDAAGDHSYRSPE